jgi:hypothetical protein
MLPAAIAIAVAAAAISGCGQSVTYTPTVTQPTITVAETGPGATTTATDTTTTATDATTGVGTVPTTTTGVDISHLVGPNGVDYQSGKLLAPIVEPSLPTPVDGILCQPARQLAYQLYAHLTIYVDGHERAVPGGIGMFLPKAAQSSDGSYFTASDCYYWLHTSTQDGMILAESPVRRQFTLGQLFKVWGQPLSSRLLATTRGAVTAIVDGHRWHGSPRAIPLREHSSIQLAVGNPIPTFQAVDWADSAL